MPADTPTAAALVLAGGSGSRVGATGNKVYLPLAGRPMIAWSLRAMVGAPGIGAVLLVCRESDRATARDLLAGDPGWAGVELVTGGPTRQASELAGLRRLAPRIRSGLVDVVLVHDGARPLVSDELVAAVLRTARRVGGAVPGLPRDDLVLAGVDARGHPVEWLGPAPPGLVAVQTPQGFRAGPLLDAYEEAHRRGFAGTDTASCVQRFAAGLAVRAVPGEGHNIKITYPHDLAVAERALARFAGSEELRRW
jgi:2-C-methyl-D-erythritol 4-phosphate cytidylyltransferase